MSLTDQALDTQLELAHWFTTSTGQNYGDAVVRAVYTAAGGEETVPDGAGWKMHRDILVRGDTFAVAADIVAALDQAAPSVPTWPLRRDDLPCPAGFALLERPIYAVDRNEGTIVIRGLAWGSHPDYAHVVLMGFTDPTDPADMMTDELTAAHQRLVELGVGVPRYWSLLAGVWEFGEAPDVSVGHGNLARFVLAFFRFVSESWVESEGRPPSRAAGKRAQRAGIPEPRVRVVHLRRARHGAEGAGTRKVEWSRRWVVSGHWRNQWYPSIQDHRPRYIMEYVKGPDDAPLVIDDRVFLVDR